MSTDPAEVGQPAATDQATPTDRVRVARFDRPLGPGADLTSPAWADAGTNAVIRRAAERAGEQARGSGYALGWAQGRQAVQVAEAELARVRREQETERIRVDAARVSAVLAALQAAVAADRAAAAPAWADLSDVLADAAFRLAGAVLDRELARADDQLRESVRIALRTLEGSPALVLHLNPDDLARLAGPGVIVPDGIRLLGDPAVSVGTVRAQTAHQRLLVDLPAALAAAVEVIRG